jgi:hypothetical protein
MNGYKNSATFHWILACQNALEINRHVKGFSSEQHRQFASEYIRLMESSVGCKAFDDLREIVRSIIVNEIDWNEVAEALK